MVSLSDREHDFKVSVNTFSLTYPKEMLTAFFEYWSEPNRPGTKMKWELEKTWHLGRRLARWANNDFGKGRMPGQQATTVNRRHEVSSTSLPTEYDEINEMLLRYQARPTNFSILDFYKWYEFLIERKMLIKLTPQEIYGIKDAYLEVEKRRAAWVMKTFDYYATRGQLFSDSLKMKV